MNLLILSKYGDLGASSRLRMSQYIPALESNAIKVTRQELLDDKLLSQKYISGSYDIHKLINAYASRIQCLLKKNKYDMAWIEKEALPWLPARLELSLLHGLPYALDYDDAIFHNYDMHRSVLVQKLFSKRIDHLMAGASLVTAGNNYLEERARNAGARHVEIIPTVIDICRYPKPIWDSIHHKQHLKIVWIGSPSTARYLDTISDALARLARKNDFVLRVIGAKVSLPGVNVECLTWTEQTEVGDILDSDIGIMPLLRTPWELGKCGYKLIQYMACGLPVIASPVGANRDIVSHGVDGFLAENPNAWEQHLHALLNEPDQRASMGSFGRQKVESNYCIQETAPRLINLLKNINGDS